MNERDFRCLYSLDFWLECNTIRIDKGSLKNRLRNLIIFSIDFLFKTSRKNNQIS
jgi:hypothetical protein